MRKHWIWKSFGVPYEPAPSDADSRLQADHLPAKAPWAENPLKRKQRRVGTRFSWLHISYISYICMNLRVNKLMKSREILLILWLNGSHAPFLDKPQWVPVEEDVWRKSEHHEVPWCWDPPNPHRGPWQLHCLWPWGMLQSMAIYDDMGGENHDEQDLGVYPMYIHMYPESSVYPVYIHVYPMYISRYISYILTNPHCSHQFVGTFPSPRKGCSVGRLGRRRQPHLPVCPPGKRPRPGPHSQRRMVLRTKTKNLTSHQEKREICLDF